MRKIIYALFACLTLISAFFILTGCGAAERARVEEAHDRIAYAINMIEIRAEGREPTTWERFMGGHSVEDEIHVIVDFKRILELAQVENEDFIRIDEGANRHFDYLYNGIATLFERTDHLRVTENNFDFLRDNFPMPSRMNDLDELPVEFTRFLLTPDKSLNVETHYGQLTVTSDFFYGRPGFGDGGFTLPEEGLKLIFAFDESNDIGNSVVTFIVRDKEGKYKKAENPGRSALIILPLSLDFMQDANGNPRYNAVAFVNAENGEEYGMIPRSFIADNHLYIYVNRTGSYRLTLNGDGKTSDRTVFLRDRGIEFVGTERNGQLVVTRGEFYSALMQIHWAEQLHFDRPIRGFDDVVPDGKLELVINIGQNLAVQIGQHKSYVLQGFPDGRFWPDEPLIRAHLYMMLAGNIEYFGYEIDELMQADDNAIGMPEDSSLYWYPYFNYLVDKNFIPYARTNKGINDVAPQEFVTVQEAEEILFKLITVDHFN